jgi:acyl-CoA reductase-like NAD-dependent aldehyde dehydrogenase
VLALREVNLLDGGRDVVNGLLEHPGVNAISFVSRAKTARVIAERGVATGKRVQAIEFVNGSRYGNAGAIFTRSGAAARQYRYEAEAGVLGVNVGVPAPVAWFPFARWKDSIDGDLHANGTDAVDFYTRKKVVTSRW